MQSGSIVPSLPSQVTPSNYSLLTNVSSASGHVKNYNILSMEQHPTTNNNTPINATTAVTATAIQYSHRVTPEYSNNSYTPSPLSLGTAPGLYSTNKPRFSQYNSSIVTPNTSPNIIEEKYMSSIQIQKQADQIAGKYIHQNVSMNNASNQYITHLHDVNTELDSSKILYNTTSINPTTVEYLKATYVQSALDHSKQVIYSLD